MECWLVSYRTLANSARHKFVSHAGILHKLAYESRFLALSCTAVAALGLLALATTALYAAAGHATL